MNSKFYSYKNPISIEIWLKSLVKGYKPKNFEIFEENGEFWVNALTSVNLSGKKIDHIPVKFKKVNGVFDVSRNKLTTSWNFPLYCETVNCSNNKLESFDFYFHEVDHLICFKNPFKNWTDDPKELPFNQITCDFKRYKKIDKKYFLEKLKEIY